jgi:GMP synthase (glutamine-hydrolysing)
MFKPERFVTEKVEEMRTQIKGKAIIACSGGVDSTVAAVMASRAVGDRLLTVYVDTGFMRKGETDAVRKIFDALGVNYRVVDASNEFFEALKGVIDPEEKRKIIGERFIRVFERTAREYGAQYLVQGTIAPDWIESGDGVRDVIKSHHNVGGLPKEMDRTLVEPLRDLYKDEVRIVAVPRHRGLGTTTVPRTGLAIRVLVRRPGVGADSPGSVRHRGGGGGESLRHGKMVPQWQYSPCCCPASRWVFRG